MKYTPNKWSKCISSRPVDVGGGGGRGQMLANTAPFQTGFQRQHRRICLQIEKYSMRPRERAARSAQWNGILEKLFQIHPKLTPRFFKMQFILAWTHKYDYS